jgi:hypothetical protein
MQAAPIGHMNVTAIRDTVRAFGPVGHLTIS